MGRPSRPTDSEPWVPRLAEDHAAVQHYGSSGHERAFSAPLVCATRPLHSDAKAGRHRALAAEPLYREFAHSEREIGFEQHRYPQPSSLHCIVMFLVPASLVTCRHRRSTSSRRTGMRHLQSYVVLPASSKHVGRTRWSATADANTSDQALRVALAAASARLEEELKQHKADREAATKAINEATAIREKEAEAYAKVKAEQGANAAAFEKAIKALERGMGSAFLQSRAAGVLRSLATRSHSEDRETLLAFLSGSEEYAPQSGQILGIMKQMHDEMAAEFKEATETEEAAIKVFEDPRARDCHADLSAFLGRLVEVRGSYIGSLPACARSGELLCLPLPCLDMPCLDLPLPCFL